MRTSDALWEVFKYTGHIGAYLLYKDYENREHEPDIPAINPGLNYVKGIKAE